jgi:hypothetical protein
MDTNTPRYIIVHSKRFNGHYDILDTETGVRTPHATTSLRWLRYECDALNKAIIK